ncbi:MAG TPA: NAD(P)/FAD-dependent oxidoreductase [Candidatus Sumerlaeota bacterium]|nr:NAD(P)/FAD-dependent oxidoreductase [Candidatus Sumerlaeota bacterium]
MIIGGNRVGRFPGLEGMDKGRMMEEKRIVVVGGGASGLVAAIVAARLGAPVLVIERMQRVGKKILATGNGRCNLANRFLSLDRYHSSDRGFVERVLGRFGLEQTLDFFRELGVETREEEDGKLFPLCGQASSVLDVLRYELDRLGVETLCDVRVQSVEAGSRGLSCVCTDGQILPCGRVIVATGGKSSPNLGSNGGGYKIAQGLGHRVVEPFPALVPIHLNAPFLKRLSGLKVEGGVCARVRGESRRTEAGELLFTDYGISGPPILQVSRLFSQAAICGWEAAVELDLFPRWSEVDLAERLARRFQEQAGKPLEFSFVGFLHKRLVPVVLKESGIESKGPCERLEPAAVKRLAALLKGWKIPVTGTESWMHSQVTAGGVELSEVEADTLESRLARGVYFAGEALDVDGDCGGFNLQWAWSSGQVAGTAAARSVLSNSL